MNVRCWSLSIHIPNDKKFLWCRTFKRDENEMKNLLEGIFQYSLASWYVWVCHHVIINQMVHNVRLSLWVSVYITRTTWQLNVGKKKNHQTDKKDFSHWFLFRVYPSDCSSLGKIHLMHWTIWWSIKQHNRNPENDSLTNIVKKHKTQIKAGKKRTWRKPIHQGWLLLFIILTATSITSQSHFSLYVGPIYSMLWQPINRRLTVVSRWH